jgi:hypothetical protein
MNASSHSAQTPQPSPLGSVASLTRFSTASSIHLVKKLSMSQLVDHLDCSPERPGSIFLTKSKPSKRWTDRNRRFLVDTLEAELLANVKECTELRRLTEYRKRGIPVSLSALDLVANRNTAWGWKVATFLQKLEALVLVKEEECTKMLDRGRTPPRTRPAVVHHRCRTWCRDPFCKHFHSESTKSVTWGTVSWGPFEL